jgi:hypothetical protein
LDTGNTANQNLTLSTAGNTITAPLLDPDQIVDTAASTGLAGQVLSSTGTGLAWIAAGSTGHTIHVDRQFWGSTIATGIPLTFANQFLSGTPTGYSDNVLNQPFDLAGVDANMMQWGAVYGSPAIGACEAGTCLKQICSVRFHVTCDQNITLKLYRVNFCGSIPQVSPPVAATCVITAPGLDQVSCCDATLGAPSDIQIGPGYGLILVAEATVEAATFVGNVHIDMNTTACP